MEPCEAACYEMNDALHDLLEHTRDRVDVHHPAFVRCKNALDAIGMACKEEGPAWRKLSDEKPPSGIYLFYHPGGKHTDGCTYRGSIDIAFWDADDGVARGGYHGPFPATHWMPQPGVPA